MSCYCTSFHLLLILAFLICGDQIHEADICASTDAVKISSHNFAGRAARGLAREERRAEREAAFQHVAGAIDFARGDIAGGMAHEARARQAQNRAVMAGAAADALDPLHFAHGRHHHHHHPGMGAAMVVGAMGIAGAAAVTAAALTPPTPTPVAVPVPVYSPPMAAPVYPGPMPGYPAPGMPMPGPAYPMAPGMPPAGYPMPMPSAPMPSAPAPTYSYMPAYPGQPSIGMGPDGRALFPVAVR